MLSCYRSRNGPTNLASWSSTFVLGFYQYQCQRTISQYACICNREEKCMDTGGGRRLPEVRKASHSLCILFPVGRLAVCNSHYWAHCKRGNLYSSGMARYDRG